MTTSPENGDTERPDELYRHVKREEWGFAVLAWDRAGRRAFQFEDGNLRVFANGFQGLVQPVDVPREEARPLLDRLIVMLADNDAQAAKERKAKTSKGVGLSLNDQVAYFKTQYPTGFYDPKWRHDVRGEGAKRRLKRHRQTAIADAQDRLSADRLATLMSEQQFGTIYETAISVLKATDLLSPAQLAPVAKLDPSQHQAFARSVRDLLHGDGPADKRFGRFVDTLMETTGTPPSWQLATALGALVNPDEHICVRVAAVREQAKGVGHRVEVRSLPTADAYTRLLAVARSVRDQLAARDFAARDLMDIYDFMRLTLSPKARRQAEALRDSRSADDEAEAA
jgi:hypothetical protein